MKCERTSSLHASCLSLSSRTNASNHLGALDLRLRSERVQAAVGWLSAGSVVDGDGVDAFSLAVFRCVSCSTDFVVWSCPGPAATDFEIPSVDAVCPSYIVENPSEQIANTMSN